VGAVEDDPLWPTMSATAERYREGLGGLTLVARAPKVRAANAQIQVLRELHTPKLRGVCIEPVHTELMRDILCELQTKGIAVVTMRHRIACEDPLPFAGIDEMAIGRALADAVADALEGAGSVAVLVDESGTQATRDRAIGFHERMERWPNVGILRELDCEGNAFVAERMVRDYMERFPRLDAWVSLDDWPLRELAADKRLLPESCRLVTGPPYPQYWPRLYDDTCVALVGAEYEGVAEAALRMCAVATRGEPLTTSTYLADPVTVTVRNINWYRVNWFKLRERPANHADNGSVPAGER
jgi:ABC-type sugar transport system substrate-binding protein